MSNLPGKFVWFEHVSADTAKARKFYEPLFGWHTESMPMGETRYAMILNGNQGIGGYVTDARVERPHWLGHLSVDDVDATYREALAAGAKSIEPPKDYPPAGRGATIADRAGAVFGLWRGSQPDRPDAAQAPAGDWCWNELWTRDEIGALAFYQRVFGYTHDTMDMGPAGTYYLLKKDGVSRAGMMRSTQPKAPSLWLPYVAVDDCDAIVSKVPHLGGQVLSPAQDIPGVGRYAVFADPVGAAIAVIKSLPPTESPAD